jgi:hypothetical protein
MRFLALLRRAPDSDDVVEFVFAVLLSVVSDDLFEKRLDSRLLDLFLSPNIVIAAVEDCDDGVIVGGP